MKVGRERKEKKAKKKGRKLNLSHLTSLDVENRELNKTGNVSRTFTNVCMMKTKASSAS